MAQDGARTPYEVYCNRCRVTFPLGARRCIHCGGRLAKERFQAQLALPPDLDDVQTEEDLPRRSGLSPFTLVWIAVLLAGYLYRACTT